MRFIYYFFTFLVFSLSSLNLYSNTIEIDKIDTGINITNKVKYFKDKSFSLKISDVSKSNYNGLFKPYKEKIFKQKYTKSRFWLKFKIKNNIKNLYKIIINLRVLFIREANLYVKAEDNVFKVLKSGSFSKHKLNYCTPVFLVSLPYNKEQTFYLSLKSVPRIITSIKIYSPINFFKQSLINNGFNSAYFGMLFIIMIVNLILYFNVGDKAYLLLGVWVVTFLCTEVFLTGYSNVLFPDIGHFFKERLSFFLGSLSTLAIIAFAKQFLDTKKTVPFYDKMLTGDFIFRIALIVLSLVPFFTLRLGMLLHIFDILFRTVLIYIICIKAVASQKRQAVYYIFAFSIFSFGIFIFMLAVDGQIAQNFVTYNVKKIGAIIANVVLTIGIGDKIRSMKKAQLKVDDLEKSNKELEKEISQRQKAEDRFKQSNEEIIRSRRALEKAFDELEKFNNMKNDFLAVASHDLRSPFTAILGFSKILLNDNSVPNKQKKFVEIIHRNAKLQLSYINDILDIIKLESGEMELELSEHKISDVVETSIELLGILAQEKGINFIFEKGKCSGISLNMDFPKIVQVMNNFISNAIKFTQKKGEVKVLCKQENGFIKVSVLDTGIGIKVENIEHIFDMYKKVMSFGTEGEKGTGLGLAICKNIIILHGGKIGAKKRKKAGSEFWFKLPIDVN